ncbi:uncharacterized protein LOC129583885 [Paramacrobiotus metropolitanus]|uniref:uncharacterized protein LOC129583885 n=1 Tax=Paramacrobiotus metropolitanus TaxID=2943436 RepID=UPI0024458407|nr:uncharacterized protein LOC129583885 [Paramacrobiotus metropolitanus]
MLSVLILCVALICGVPQVASQFDSTTSSSTGFTAHVEFNPQGGNQSGSAAGSTNTSNYAPITQFFGQVLRNQVWGIHKCKKPKDCGLGLRCDLLLNLCVPFNTPIFTDIEKPCLNQSDCSPMHACQAGFCRFCGPKSCRNSMDCCAGSFATAEHHGTFFECLNIEDNEKLALAKQLGRVPANYQPLPKSAGGKSEEFGIESEELLQLGSTAQGDAAMYGKRCWQRCNVDNDCYFKSTPADIKQSLGCCNGVCTRRQSCVKASQQAIQQMQILQQQQQQQLLLHQQQQQVLQQQQHQLHGQQHAGHAHGQQQQQGGWGAHGHGQIQQPTLNVQVQFQPRPNSWQEAQQQQPNLQG